MKRVAPNYPTLMPSVAKYRALPPWHPVPKAVVRRMVTDTCLRYLDDILQHPPLAITDAERDDDDDADDDDDVSMWFIGDELMRLSGELVAVD